MKDYFHFSCTARILFEGWYATTWAEMLGSCLAVMTFAILFEGFKVFRQYVAKRTKTYQEERKRLAKKQSNDGDLELLENKSKKSWFKSVRDLTHVLQSVLHMVQVFFAMCLMLIFMTFNMWLCLSLAVGSALGYLLFAWYNPVSNPGSNPPTKYNIDYGSCV